MWWPFLFEFVAAYWQQSRLLRQQSWIRIQHFLVAVRGSRVDQYCMKKAMRHLSVAATMALLPASPTCRGMFVSYFRVKLRFTSAMPRDEQ